MKLTPIINFIIMLTFNYFEDEKLVVVLEYTRL